MGDETKNGAVSQKLHQERARAKVSDAIATAAFEDPKTIAASSSATGETFLSAVEKLLRQKVFQISGTIGQKDMSLQHAGDERLHLLQQKSLNLNRNSSSFSVEILNRSSATDVAAALKCLEIVRECIFQSTKDATVPATEAATHSSTTLQLCMTTIVQCLCNEAAAASSPGEKGQHDANNGIGIGMALLFVLLLDQLSSQQVHQFIHCEEVLLTTFLKTLECSSYTETTEPVSFQSARPLLLLIAALYHCYSRILRGTDSSGAVNSEDKTRNSACSNSCCCHPTAAVWKQLLRLITKDKRASVRHRARQVAQNLLQAVVDAAKPLKLADTTAELSLSEKKAGAPGFSEDTYKWRQQEVAIASAAACVNALHHWAVDSRKDALSCSSNQAYRNGLLFLRRALAQLLTLSSSGALLCGSNGSRSDSNNHSSSDMGVAARGRQLLLRAVRRLCLQVALFSQSVGFTGDAAEALRCVTGAVADAIQQQEQQHAQHQLLQAIQQGSLFLERKQQKEGDFFLPNSSGNPPGSRLLLCVAVDLLPCLLEQQQQRREHLDDMHSTSNGSTEKSSVSLWEAVSSSSFAGGGAPGTIFGERSAAAPTRRPMRNSHNPCGGVFQYAAAWCSALPVFLEVLLLWNRFLHGSVTLRSGLSAPRVSEVNFQQNTVIQSKTNGSSSSSQDTAFSSALETDNEEEAAGVLLKQLERLTLSAEGNEGELPRTKGCSLDTPGATGATALVDVADEKRKQYSESTSFSVKAWTRTMHAMARAASASSDEQFIFTAAVAGVESLIEQAAHYEIPVFHAAVPTVLSLLHFKYKRWWKNTLQLVTKLLQALEAYAIKQFLKDASSRQQQQGREFTCSNSHSAQQLVQQQQSKSEDKSRSGKSLCNYVDVIAAAHYSSFLPLLQQVVCMLATAETGFPPDCNGNSNTEELIEENVGFSNRQRQATLAALQKKDLAGCKGELRNCFTAALRTFKSRLILRENLLGVSFRGSIGTLSSITLEDSVFGSSSFCDGGNQRSSNILDDRSGKGCGGSSGSQTNSKLWCSNSWLLPLLPHCLGRDRLSVFTRYFLPVSQQLQRKAQEALARGCPVEARELCRLQQQVLSLLPGYCNTPLDLAECLSSDAGQQLIDTMLQYVHEPVLRGEMCAAICNLCEAAAVTLSSEPSKTLADVKRLDFSAARPLGAVVDDVLRRAGELWDGTEKQRAAALLQAISMQKEAVKHPEVVAAAVAVAYSVDSKTVLQHFAARVIGFLVVRFLQVHRASSSSSTLQRNSHAAAAVASSSRSFLAAMLLGKKENLQELTQSAKMKAGQHLLRAIKAYAPFCPEELLKANLKRFTTAFLGRAHAAADTAAAAAETSVLGPAESAALVDVSDALLPVLPAEAATGILGCLRELIDVCIKGLRAWRDTRIAHAASAVQIASYSAANCSESVHVLQALLRRGYKAIKHLLSLQLDKARGLRWHMQLKLQQHNTPVAKLFSCQLMEKLWDVLEPGRSVSWAGSAGKPRLGCLRLYVCYCLYAVAEVKQLQANKSAGNGEALADVDSVEKWEAVLDKALPFIIPEILMSLKTPSRAVRQMALDALLSTAEASRNDSQRLKKIVFLVLTGLGGCTDSDPSLMKSAATLALARLIFSYSEYMEVELVVEIASVVLVLLEDANKPVYLAALHFVKVLIFVLKAEYLEPLLPAIMKLFTSRQAVKAKLKIRRITEKLLKKVGDVSLQAVFPKEHFALLRHVQRDIRRQHTRSVAQTDDLLSDEFGEERQSGRISDEFDEEKGCKQRRKKSNLDEFEEEEVEEDEKCERGSAAKADNNDADTDEASKSGNNAMRLAVAKNQGLEPSALFLKEMLDALEESQEEGCPFDVKEGGSRKRARGRQSREFVCVAEDKGGAVPLDFLSTAPHRVLVNMSMRKRTKAVSGDTCVSEKKGDKGRTLWDKEGRLVVMESASESETERKVSAAVTSRRKGLTSDKVLPRTRLKKAVVVHTKVTSDIKRPTLSILSARRAALKAAKQQKRAGHFVQQSGEAFKARNAKGDIQKRSKMEPFAYIRLNPTMLREKYRPKALKSLSTIVTRKALRANTAAVIRTVRKTIRKRCRRRQSRKP